MHTHRPWLSLAIGSVTALAVASAAAAGLGSGASSAVLGQPLDFSVQVRLDSGDSVTPECVTAEVTAGDRRVPPGLVRALLEMTGPETARVRVQTQTSIDEPVIGIQLSVGCTARMTRRYVVLADPPHTAAQATAPAFAANPAPVPDAALASSAPPPAALNAAATANTSAMQTAADASPSRAVAVPAQSPRTRADRARAVAPPVARPRAQRRESNREADRAARAAKAANAAKAGAPARLTLEAAEAPLRSTEAAAVEEALAAVAQAAGAARAAASAASASAERMATLERTVDQLRTESKASRDLAAQVRQRLADTEGASAWMLPLMVVAALLAALAAWLAWRLGQVQTARQQGWRDASVASAAVPAQDMAPSRQPTAPIPFVTSELQRPSPQAANRPRAAPAWPPPAPPVA